MGDTPSKEAAAANAAAGGKGQLHPAAGVRPSTTGQSGGGGGVGSAAATNHNRMRPPATPPSANGGHHRAVSSTAAAAAGGVVSPNSSVPPSPTNGQSALIRAAAKLSSPLAAAPPPAFDDADGDAAADATTEISAPPSRPLSRVSSAARFSAPLASSAGGSPMHSPYATPSSTVRRGDAVPSDPAAAEVMRVSTIATGAKTTSSELDKLANIKSFRPLYPATHNPLLTSASAYGFLPTWSSAVPSAIPLGSSGVGGSGPAGSASTHRTSGSAVFHSVPTSPPPHTHGSATPPLASSLSSPTLFAANAGGGGHSRTSSSSGWMSPAPASVSSAAGSGTFGTNSAAGAFSPPPPHPNAASSSTSSAGAANVNPVPAVHRLYSDVRAHISALESSVCRKQSSLLGEIDRLDTLTSTKVVPITVKKRKELAAFVAELDNLSALNSELERTYLSVQRALIGTESLRLMLPDAYRPLTFEAFQIQSAAAPPAPLALGGAATAAHPHQLALQHAGGPVSSLVLSNGSPHAPLTSVADAVVTAPAAAAGGGAAAAGGVSHAVGSGLNGLNGLVAFPSASDRAAADAEKRRRLAMLVAQSGNPTAHHHTYHDHSQRKDFFSNLDHHAM